MSTNLFRKVSLERLTSPEQLDKLLVIVKLRGWLALITLLLITIAILIWSFVGQIPIATMGKGILLDPRGLHGVYSHDEGRITRILARTGAKVKKGDVLIMMENALFLVKFQEISHEIAYLKENLETEESLYNEQKKLGEQEFKRKMELENLILENQKAKLALLEKQLSKASPDLHESLKKEILEQRNIIQSQLATIEIFHTKKKMDETNENIDAIKTEIFQKQEALHILQSKIDNLIIKAPEDGRVIEIDVMLGREVPSGTPMIWIQALTEKEASLPFYSFVPISMGEKIKKGMHAQISFLAIDSQKYGQLEGKVLRVLPYAASLSAQQLAGIPSRVLREYLSADPTAILVVIQPIRDPSTPTGYKWTTDKGPPLEEILPGAIGTARIILESKRPITYVLPILTEK